ncbi:putative HTH-type transcriptional regulator [Corynebacterium kalinowskii]|uniref:HTH-type transcriptional regulator n=1 Tax=Corynebacterium kalinowskii TaxID=2675216 RepID=A0A6B8VNN8_9CORY|nr:TetR/AcrR family transcriptional regulator [Corynebacterium kalinowskii]QGU01157.1 putative HTH-type transcriptional regulator [Corynebacterium kalinowskii]
MALGKRELHRQEMMGKILQLADEQLVDGGAQSLSLREIARDLGLASSAIYRYVASRDELLTLLLVRGFNSLADAVDAAVGVEKQPERQLRALAGSVRGWARINPEQYALLYGTPVPGFHADQGTVAPGSRVLMRLAEIAQQGAPRIDAHSFEPLVSEVPLELTAAQLAAGASAWGMLLGAINSEMFGYLGPDFGGVSDELFEIAVDRIVKELCLRDCNEA